MSGPSARRLLAPLASLTLSTLSCAVFGPRPDGVVPTTITPPDAVLELASSPEPLLAPPSSRTAFDPVPALDVLAMRQTPLDVVLGTHAPEPWTAEPLRMTAPVGAGRSVAMRSAHPRNAAMVAAVHEHLIRYRNRTGLTDAEIGRLARTVVREARRNDFDPGLVLAVMHVESRYDTFAVSPKDAMGLMQLLPSTGEWMAAKLGLRWEGPQTLFDPTANVRLGVAYLRELADRYGSLHTALSAYNWGPGHIDRRIATGAPLPRIYAELVFEAYGRAANRS